MNLARSTIEKRWRDKFSGSFNPLTPVILIRDQTPDERFIYELSQGTDFDGLDCYGVTVLELKWGYPDEHRVDLSQLFTGPDAKEEALNYVKELPNV